MSVSAKLDYACRAALELAVRHAEDSPVALREIAARQQIPQPFLVQILQQLKAAGIVTSSRGSQGGYRLTRDPSDLSLWTILEAVGCDGPPAATSGLETRLSEELSQIWQQAADAYRRVLQEHSLAELAEKLREPGGVMFYI